MAGRDGVTRSLCWTGSDRVPCASSWELLLLSAPVLGGFSRELPVPSPSPGKERVVPGLPQPCQERIRISQPLAASLCSTHRRLTGVCFRLARHRKIVEPEVVGESDSEVEGEAWRLEREDTSEEEEEEIDDEVRSESRVTGAGKALHGTGWNRLLRGRVGCRAELHGVTAGHDLPCGLLSSCVGWDGGRDHPASGGMGVSSRSSAPDVFGQRRQGAAH